LNVIRVSEINAVRQANIVGTSGYKSVVHPVMTKVTLLCHVFLCIKGNGMIRAGIHTKPAAGARFLVQYHNAVISLCNGLFRATVHTCGLIAVYADIRLKYDIRFIVNGAEIPFKDVDQFDPFGSVIFLLAGHFAGFASPAGYVVYDQCVFLHCRSPSRFLGVNLAQKCSNAGSTHGSVAGVIGIIRQNIDVGFVPAVERIFLLGKPPAMFGGNDSRVHAGEKFCPLSDLAPGRFNDDPISFFDAFFFGGLGVYLNHWIPVEFSEPGQLAVLAVKKAGLSPSRDQDIWIFFE
jgi:hypothetical protein